MRNIRQDAMNLLKKASNEENIPEDEVKSLFADLSTLSILEDKGSNVKSVILNILGI